MTERAEPSARQAVPPIAAIFLVVFDQKIGYSIAFKRAIPGLQLEGVVEYKSLPSGLHNVQSDLVYFVHDKYAGISAFVQKEAGQADRGAHFAAVGVLVPLTYGRLGRSWLHAAALQEMAQRVVKDIHDTTELEQYWEAHRMEHDEEQAKDGDVETSSPKQGSMRRRTTRALSDAAGLGADPRTMSSDHPAMSISNHLDMFGPLLFPLYRAALLRKRILILTSPPVRQACDLVYNLSVLSNMPSEVAHVVSNPDDLSPARPLFNVGVHDIGYLANLPSDESYIACSTDEILATKTKLYDVLVELPLDGKESGLNSWPTFRTAEGEQIKATQRDLRRYRALRKELQRIERSAPEQYRDDEDEEEREDEDEGDTAALITRPRSIWDGEDNHVSLDGEAKLVEPTSWTAMAYTGLLWWASAGEKDAWLEEEASQDSALLADLPLPDSARRGSSRPSPRNSRSGKNMLSSVESVVNSIRDDAQARAMLLIAFARRMTTMTLGSVAEMIDAVDDNNDDEEESRDAGEQSKIFIDSEDVRRMGLDVWSQADRQFARELFGLYFDRQAEVRSQGVECCGIKIC